MKSLKTKILVLLFFLLIVPTALADWIGIGEGDGFVEIRSWEEVVVVDESDLEGHIVLELLVNGLSNQKMNEFQLYIRPESPSEKFPEDANVEIVKACFGTKRGTNYNDPLFELNCEKNISFIERPKTFGWEEWRYKFNVSEVENQQWVTVYLKYKVPN